MMGKKIGKSIWSSHVSPILYLLFALRSRVFSSMDRFNNIVFSIFFTSHIHFTLHPVSSFVIDYQYVVAQKILRILLLFNYCDIWHFLILANFKCGFVLHRKIFTVTGKMISKTIQWRVESYGDILVRGAIACIKWKWGGTVIYLHQVAISFIGYLGIMCNAAFSNNADKTTLEFHARHYNIGHGRENWSWQRHEQQTKQ